MEAAPLGIRAGTATLQDGRVLPVLVPDATSFYTWSNRELASNAGLLGDQSERIPTSFQRLMDRVFLELSNRGSSSEERAINFSASWASAQIFVEAAKGQLALESVVAERLSFCSPGSDCLDVKWTFFDPKASTQSPRTVMRLTVDVADVKPVALSPLRRWNRF